ncbi:FGGY-family carbohydrate kinase [Mesorhizobium sp. IMUNJ 23033]|uniref:xylulokinase n=1 Tax=Mesorhizobium sp. IMUNJ 23033 TaxID=3378039 RepID=UPI003850C5B9
MKRDLFLAIDVGTGSVRAALVDHGGNVVSIRTSEHDQIIPAYGWSEQRPRDWWAGVVSSIRAVLAGVTRARERVSSVAACGQMHGTVLLDQNGQLTRESVPLWNDKRTASLVAEFEARFTASNYLADTANPATPAWPGFKLQWIRDQDPEAYRRAAIVMMPKDYINFRLTGELAMDWTDAACSFLMDPRTGQWSKLMCERLGLDIGKLPGIRMPVEILGSVSDAAAQETGLAAGLPVLVGGGDYPVALLGSGVCRPGLGSDATGTSSIVTLITDRPLLDPEISNVGTPEGNWGAFMLLESGGDAVRWARRAFHEKALGYDEIVAKAAEAPAGSERLFFLPYLMGERLGSHRNARAQFFGVTAGHGLAHLHRAILEGVAFAVRRHIRMMETNSGRKLERVIASGGGAKTPLWLKIKASAYGIPIAVPQEPECGVIGCAILAATAEGRFADLEQGAGAFVRYADEVAPDPRWAETYARMQPVFERLYHHAQVLYDDLDRLA